VTRLSNVATTGLLAMKRALSTRETVLFYVKVGTIADSMKKTTRSSVAGVSADGQDRPARRKKSPRRRKTFA
jgi:hypothetical protein